jgi:gliding motility-associated-like protein
LNCTDTGTIIINTLTGFASSYQIILGPQTFPNQTSNTFSGLNSGQYRIRVFDSCGQAFVRDYNLSVAIPTLSIGAFTPPNIATSCSSIDVSNTITSAAGMTITYPLTVKQTIQPPNGTPNIVLIQNISSGAASSLTVTNTINLYQNLIFNYSIEVTDGCGRIFFLNNNQIDPNPKVLFADLSNKCGEKYLSITASNFFPPFTVEFEVAPTGFNPASFNTQNPGPFSAPTIIYGSITNVVPFGNYKIKITDGCGRTASSILTNVILEVVQPVFSSSNAGCGSLFGSINISIPNARALTSVIMTSAPNSYSQPLPQNISNQINAAGTLSLLNFPIGLYSFILRDECGTVYNLNNIEVPAFVLSGLIFNQLPNCVPSSGSLKIISGNQLLTNLSITAAPPNFVETLPFSLNSRIVSGIAYISDLPVGNYTFVGQDACGYNLSSTVSVIGYNNTLGNTIDVQRNCGSFNLKVTDATNGINEQKYWLQKLNTVTGIWENPFTGAPYIAGAIPDATTAFVLSNNSTVFNLDLTGNFRILKTFTSYNNGNATAIFKTCLEVFGQFDFFDSLKIDGVYNINCSGSSGTSDVLINVIGSPPYTFKINSRNGDTTFNINNGNNNTFLGLTAGTYNFEVQDQCGSIKNGDYAVGTLPNLVSANAPQAMLSCQTTSQQFATFDLTTQNSAILGTQNKDNYIVSFYLTSVEASNAINPIANPNFFINSSNPQTIFVRVIHKIITGCFATTSFQIIVGQKPIVILPAKAIVCENGTVEISANPGFDVYEWSNGMTTRTITVNEPGDYTLIAKNRYLTLFCSSDPKTITVEKSGKAKLVEINTQDWSENNNSLTITVTGFGKYEYSVDNINFQQTGVFNNLISGVYTIYVKDINGCPTLKVDTYFLNFPKFFTPNGDGFNDSWQIQFSNLEPKIITRIFDRFGKLLYEIDSKNKGWDGTLNGNPLPSDDYWFVVERQDGRVFKGHFSLKR